MSRLPVGTRIRIIGNSSNHHYRIGAIYRVHQDGNFDLFSAIDEKGNIGHLAQWKDCERAGIGWEWLRTQLDPRSLELLSAFTGVEHLTLKPEIENQLVLSLPDLDEAILRVLPAIENTTSQNTPKDPDYDPRILDPTHLSFQLFSSQHLSISASQLFSFSAFTSHALIPGSPTNLQPHQLPATFANLLRGAITKLPA